MHQAFTNCFVSTGFQMRQTERKKASANVWQMRVKMKDEEICTWFFKCHSEINYFICKTVRRTALSSNHRKF